MNWYWPRATEYRIHHTWVECHREYCWHAEYRTKIWPFWRGVGFDNSDMLSDRYLFPGRSKEAAIKVCEAHAEGRGRASTRESVFLGTPEATGVRFSR